MLKPEITDETSWFEAMADSVHGAKIERFVYRWSATLDFEGMHGFHKISGSGETIRDAIVNLRDRLTERWNDEAQS